MFVVTGSFDVFHKGHESLLSQVEVLRKAVGDEFFTILIMKDHPIKNFLISPEDRLNIVSSWVDKAKIQAKIFLTKCTSEKEADEFFFQILGMKVTDERVIIVNGIKKEDVDKSRSEMISFGYNKKCDGKKKIFLISNEEDDYWQSSSKIKKYLANKSDNYIKYKEAIQYLESIGACEMEQGAYLERYRDELNKKFVCGELFRNTNVPFPRNDE